MHKFTVKIEMTIETEQFTPNIGGEIELRQFLKGELEGLNGTQYVAEVSSLSVRLAD